METVPTQSSVERSRKRRGPLAVRRRALRRAMRRLFHDDQGTTSLEWALLLGAVALPSMVILTMCLGIIVDYYRMMTQISSLPLP